jgi:hypothetical protein
MDFKQGVYSKFLEVLNEQIDAFQFNLDQLSESVMNETKSTAGDKHETALSMLQLEQSRMAKHLYDAVDNKTIYEQIDIETKTNYIVSGSLIKTSKGYFFMSIALPKIELDNQLIIAISPKSPLGEKLMGKEVGDCIEVNAIKHTIELIA